MRKALIGCLGWDICMKAWKAGDPILTSRKEVCSRAQELLFHYHKEHFPEEPLPLLYCPKDTRKQNIMVTISGPTQQQEELVLNEVVFVSVETAQQVLDGKWRDRALGYAKTVHSSQGLTLSDPQKVWIIDDYLQWSNLA